MHLMMPPEYGWFIGHIRGTNLDRRNFSESFAQTVGLLYTFVHMSAYAAMGRARQAAQGAVKNTLFYFVPKAWEFCSSTAYQWFSYSSILRFSLVIQAVGRRHEAEGVRRTEL